MSTHSLQNKQHNRMHSLKFIYPMMPPVWISWWQQNNLMQHPLWYSVSLHPNICRQWHSTPYYWRKKRRECLTTSCKFIFRIQIYCQHMALPTYWQCIAPPIAPTKKITFSNKLSMSSPLKEHLYTAWLHTDGCHYNWAAIWEGYVRKHLNGPNQLQNTSVYLSFAPTTWAA